MPPFPHSPLTSNMNSKQLIDALLDWLQQKYTYKEHQELYDKLLMLKCEIYLEDLLG